MAVRRLLERMLAAQAARRDRAVAVAVAVAVESVNPLMEFLEEAAEASEWAMSGVQEAKSSFW